jgi:hypothetical protein
MGFFNKSNPAAAGGNMQAQAQAAMAQQRALGIDTANFGGPSNAAIADDDPIFEPIDGISIEHYAWIAKLAANQGVTDEAGLKAVAEANGINGDQFLRGSQGWVARMGQAMAVGQKFRQYYDQY